MLSRVFLVAVCFLQISSIICKDDDGFDIESTRELMKTMPRSTSIRHKRFVLTSFNQVNWHRAAHICKYNGMDLAIVSSIEEQKLIEKLIEDTGGFDGEKGFWISGNDLGRQHNWYWASSGRPFEYTNWRKGEPNDRKDRNERCVQFHGKLRDHEWNDVPCEFIMDFVCEELDF